MWLQMTILFRLSCSQNCLAFQYVDFEMMKVIPKTHRAYNDLIS